MSAEMSIVRKEERVKLVFVRSSLSKPKNFFYLFSVFSVFVLDLEDSSS